MSIKGTMGYCDSTVKSATYGVTQLNDFLDDAKSLGFTIEHHEGHVSALNSANLITGEWSDKHGGQLAWSA